MNPFRVGDRVTHVASRAVGTVQYADDASTHVLYGVADYCITYGIAPESALCLMSAASPVDPPLPVELEDGTPCLVVGDGAQYGSDRVLVAITDEPSVWNHGSAVYHNMHREPRSWVYNRATGQFDGDSGDKQLRLRNRAPVTVPEQPSIEQMQDACMCMWEACLEDKRLAPVVNAARDNFGVGELRAFIRTVAPALEADWQAIPDDKMGDQSFDWEFVPAWLMTKVRWDLTGNTMPTLI